MMASCAKGNSNGGNEALVREGFVGPKLKGRKLQLLWPATGTWHEADVHRVRENGQATVWYGGDEEEGEKEDIDLKDAARRGHVAWMPGEGPEHGVVVEVDPGGLGDEELEEAERIAHEFAPVLRGGQQDRRSRLMSSAFGLEERSDEEDEGADAAEEPEAEDQEWAPNADKPDDEVWEMASARTEHEHQQGGRQRKRSRQRERSREKADEESKDREHQEQPQKSQKREMNDATKEEEEARARVKDGLIEALRKGAEERAEQQGGSPNYKVGELLAREAEAEIKSANPDGRSYKKAARAILFNLKDPNNPDLRSRVITGEIPPRTLPKLTSEELAAPHLASERERVRQRAQKQVFLSGESASGEQASQDTSRIVRKTKKGEEVVEDEREPEPVEQPEPPPSINTLPMKPSAPQQPQQRSSPEDLQQEENPAAGETAPGDGATKEGGTTKIGGEDGQGKPAVKHSFKRQHTSSDQHQAEHWEAITELEGTSDSRLTFEPVSGEATERGLNTITGLRSGQRLTVKGRVPLSDATKYAQKIRHQSRSRTLSLLKVKASISAADDTGGDDEGNAGQQAEGILAHLKKKGRAAFVEPTKGVELYIIPPSDEAEELSPECADETSGHLLGALVHRTSDKHHHHSSRRSSGKHKATEEKDKGHRKDEKSEAKREAPTEASHEQPSTTGSQAERAENPPSHTQEQRREQEAPQQNTTTSEWSDNVSFFLVVEKGKERSPFHVLFCPHWDC